MKNASLITILSLLGFASIGQANDFADAANKMCDKMKACTQQQMAQQQGMNPQMKEMMNQMVDQACTSIQQQYNPAMQLHTLHEQAVRCMNSMAELDCSMLEQGGKTEACEKLEALARQHQQ